MVFDSEAFGVPTRRQLEVRGLDGHHRAQAVRRGELVRVRPGVFVVQPPPDHPTDRWRQACAVELVAAGPDAVLTGAAGAALRNLDGWEAPVPIEVNVPRRSGRRRSGVHRRKAVGDTVQLDGLPVASIEQTLLELGIDLSRRRLCFGMRRGGWLSPADQVELAVESALRRPLVSEARLLEMTALAPRQRPGVAVLAEVLGRRPPDQPATESYLETRCVQVLRDAGLPTGQRQVRIADDLGRFVGRVDFQLAPRVLLEVDGRAFHGGERHEEDRRRWTALSSLGYGLAVFTWQDIEFQPRLVTGRVSDLLERYR